MIAAGILLTAAAIFIISGISLVKNSLLFKEKQDLIDKNIMNNSDISDSAEILLESQAVIIKCINIAVKFFTLIALFGFIGSFFWVIFLLIKMHSFFMYGILLFILGASSILPIKTFTQGLIELKNKDFIVKKNSENQTEDSIKAILDYQSAICAVLGKLYKSDVQFSLMAGISAIITGIIDFIIYPGHYLLGIFSIIMGMLAIGVGISVNKRVSDCQIKFNRIIEHLDFPEQKV
jgi:phosphate starvation-inducible membrane PsiE